MDPVPLGCVCNVLLQSLYREVCHRRVRHVLSSSSSSSHISRPFLGRSSVYVFIGFPTGSKLVSIRFSLVPCSTKYSFQHPVPSSVVLSAIAPAGNRRPLTASCTLQLNARLISPNYNFVRAERSLLHGSRLLSRRRRRMSRLKSTVHARFVIMFITICFCFFFTLTSVFFFLVKIHTGLVRLSFSVFRNFLGLYTASVNYNSVIIDDVFP